MSKVRLQLFSEGYREGVFLENAIDNEDGKKVYKIQGIMAQADSLNRNGRIYPQDVLFPDIERYVEKYVKMNLAWGELDHPDKRVGVKMQHVSHLITDLHFEGTNVIGTAVVADTPNGEIVKRCMDIGGRMAVSTRGLGKAIEKSGVEIMQLYHMTAIDVVNHPSGLDCFMNGVVEGVDYLVEEELVSKIEAYKIIKQNDVRIAAKDFTTLVNSILRGNRHG